MQSDIVKATCYGIGEMSLLVPAAREFASAESVKTVLGYINE